MGNSFPIILTIIITTIINILFTFFYINYTQESIYGWKDNFEKFKHVNKIQYTEMFKNFKTLEDIDKHFEKQVETPGWWMEAENNTEELLPENEVNSVDSKELSKISAIKWDKSAPYSLYEFSDLECPFCQSFHQSWVVWDALKEIKELNYVFKHFPLKQIHPWAEHKWTVGICLQKEKWDEVFFKYIDGIFEAGTNISKSEAEKIAINLWISEEKLQECISEWTAKKEVNTSLQEWLKIWVSWTPTIMVINNSTGKVVRVESRSVEAIKEAIEQAK